MRALASHSVTEARERGWATLKNGELLLVAEQAGFDVFLTADKNIRYQQNLKERKIAIIVLTQLRWSLVRKHLSEIVEGGTRWGLAALPKPVPKANHMDAILSSFLRLSAQVVQAVARQHSGGAPRRSPAIARK